MYINMGQADAEGTSRPALIEKSTLPISEKLDIILDPVTMPKPVKFGMLALLGGVVYYSVNRQMKKKKRSAAIKRGKRKAARAKKR